MLLLAPFLVAASVAEHPGCSGNCMDCHKISKNDAEAVVKKLKDAGNLPADAVVKELKVAPAGGLWQIDLEAGGKKGVVYLDFSKKYIVPQLIPIELFKRQEQRKINFSTLPLKDAFVLGSKKASKKIAIFTDPECPACRALHEELKKVLSTRKDLGVYIFFNPLPMHKDAYKKAHAILCEKTTAILDAAYAGKPVPEPNCSNDRLEKSMALAKKLEFPSTPTMVRDDGMVHVGGMTVEGLNAWIDRKDAKAGK